MKTNNARKQQKPGMALALVATLGFGTAFADNADSQFDQNALIDWGHKAQAALTKNWMTNSTSN